tara:strand:+ start:35524 stop:35862 length:339 start_codon:yes stop_codon:yes gene_type:complete
MKNSIKFNSEKRTIINQRKKRILNSGDHIQNSCDVLISAVISPYLLTHLHQTLQKSEFAAKRDGRLSHAANFAKLRKVLCLDARSMVDASAKEIKDPEKDLYINDNSKQNVA